MGILDEAIREHLELKRRRGADPSEVERLEHEALGPVRRAPQDVPDGLMDEESPVAGAYPADAHGPDEVPDWGDQQGDTGPFDRGDEFQADIPPRGAAESEPATEFMQAPDAGYEPAGAERTPEAPRHHEIAEEWEAHERQGLAAEAAGFEPDQPAPLPPAPAAPGGQRDDPPPHGDSPGPVFGGERQPDGPQEYDLEQETLEHDVEGEELGHPREPGSGQAEDVLEETPDFLQDTPDHDRLWFEQRPPRDFDFDD